MTPRKRDDPKVERLDRDHLGFAHDNPRRATCTQAQLRRIIKAARNEGLHIAAIRPDGTVIVSEDGKPLLPVDQGEPSLSDLDGARRWGDDEA